MILDTARTFPEEARWPAICSSCDYSTACMADSEQVVWQGIELVGIIFIFQWALAGIGFVSSSRVISES